MGKRIWSDNEFIAALASSNTRLEIIKKLKLPPSGESYKTLRRTAKRLGLHLEGLKRASNLSWDESDLKIAVAQSICYSDTLRKLNLAISGSSLKGLKKHIKRFSISIQHFDPYKARAISQKKNKIKSEDIFKIDSIASSSLVRKRYLGLMTPKCTGCSNNGWHNNRPLTLQLDHINGIKSDNRLTNLRWLCPNCHSQTPTFGMKKRLVCPMGIEPISSE